MFFFTFLSCITADVQSSTCQTKSCTLAMVNIKQPVSWTFCLIPCYHLSQKLTHFTFWVFWDPRGFLWPGQWYQDKYLKYCHPLAFGFCKILFTSFWGPKRPHKVVGSWWSLSGPYKLPVMHDGKRNQVFLKSKYEIKHELLKGNNHFLVKQLLYCTKSCTSDL